MAIRIARYNGSIASAGGSVLTYNESTFDIGSGFNSEVYSFAVQNDGKILIGGKFTTFNGESAQRIVRLNSDGSKDTSFQTNSGFTGGGGDTAIVDMKIQSTGKIIVVGNFSAFSGVSVGYIARLNTNGTLDESFNNGGSGFNTQTNSITMLANDKMYIGGEFYSYNGNGCLSPIRLNSDGSYDSVYNYNQTSVWGNLAWGFSNIARAGFYELSDGSVLFTNYDDNTYGGYTALEKTNSSGSQDSSFRTNIGTNFGLVETGSDRINAYSIKVDSNNKILLGGDFLEWTGNTSLHKLIRLNSNGSVDTTFANGKFDTEANTMIMDMRILDDGKLLIAGGMVSYSGVSVSSLIKLNSDGSLDNTFNRKVWNNHVNAIEVLSDGTILAGGRFTTFDGHNHSRFIKLKANGDDATEY